MIASFVNTLFLLLVFRSLLVAGTPVAANTEHSLAKRLGLDILDTTVTDLLIIDWVPIESQGTIASPPPVTPTSTPDPSKNVSVPLSELQLPGAQLGPAGTVPIPRLNTNYPKTQKQLPPSSLSSRKSTEKRQYSGVHWYVNSEQEVDNIGGSAVFSLYDAYVEESSDFSLLQTAVTVSGQTIEAGWINYPDQIDGPHLFTYYTTVNYESEGDNIGGWNTEYKGWVQVDPFIFPGTTFPLTSSDGGLQFEMRLEYLLFEGNWWLSVLGIWIGYFPASIFDNGQYDPSLSSGSSYIFYYGEIYNSESAFTTTDMGSGEFADEGFGKAGYIHNMQYRDTSGILEDYTSSFQDSDSSRYSHDYYADGGLWGVYTYIGGPGAGQTVGE